VGNDCFPADVVHLTDDVLRNWPLPTPSGHGDKEERGRVLMIAGSREMPGAVILAANAALRAGAGKLTIATGESVASLVALATPEARVIPLPETSAGGIAASAAERLGALGRNLDAVLIGPGMLDEAAVCEFVLALVTVLGSIRVVLDAAAMGVVRRKRPSGDDRERRSSRDDSGNPLKRRRDSEQPRGPLRFIGAQRFAAPLLLTPHAGEMAHLTSADKAAILANPVDAARSAALRWNAVVALKGAITHIAVPDGRVWRHEGGNVGLAISGSGDTLSGLIVGLASRGASLEQAAAWGVALHARAGQQLAARLGTLGYLAREIAGEVPGLMDAFARRSP